MDVYKVQFRKHSFSKRCLSLAPLILFEIYKTLKFLNAGPNASLYNLPLIGDLSHAPQSLETEIMYRLFFGKRFGMKSAQKPTNILALKTMR